MGGWRRWPPSTCRCRSRIRQILNLKHMAGCPRSSGPVHLCKHSRLQASAYDVGKPVLNMRVVVGDEYKNATPVFADSMTFVVFRPY